MGVLKAARATGADVPVCLMGRARIMRGVGDVLDPLLALPPLIGLLVNPGAPVATKEVFSLMKIAPGATTDFGGHPRNLSKHAGGSIDRPFAKAATTWRRQPACSPRSSATCCLFLVRRLAAASPGCRVRRNLFWPFQGLPYCSTREKSDSPRASILVGEDLRFQLRQLLVNRARRSLLACPYQCLRAVVAEPNWLKNRLYLANVTTPQNALSLGGRDLVVS